MDGLAGLRKEDRRTLAKSFASFPTELMLSGYGVYTVACMCLSSPPPVLP